MWSLIQDVWEQGTEEIFVSKSDEVRGGWRKICNEEQNGQIDDEIGRAYSMYGGKGKP
jgi:hypothetical protein